MRICRVDNRAAVVRGALLDLGPHSSQARCSQARAGLPARAAPAVRAAAASDTSSEPPKPYHSRETVCSGFEARVRADGNAFALVAPGRRDTSLRRAHLNLPWRESWASR